MLAIQLSGLLCRNLLRRAVTTQKRRRTPLMSEVFTAAAKPGACGSIGKPKSKATRKSTKTRSRHASPAGKSRCLKSPPSRQEAMDVAVAAAKRYLGLDSTLSMPGASKGQPGALGQPKGSRIYVAPNIAMETRRKPCLQI